MNLCLGFLVPYAAVLVFWYGLGNAWFTIAAYHLLILLFARGRVPLPTRPPHRMHLAWALPAILAGPLFYLLYPHLATVSLNEWLAARRMSPTSILLLLPYFSIVHPWLEQTHWHPLRQRTPLAHPIFAGYHILVLPSLTTWPWMVVVFCILMLVSHLWGVLGRRSKSLTPAYVSHALADFGIVIAAWLRT
jgi:hypothetical protein